MTRRWFLLPAGLLNSGRSVNPQRMHDMTEPVLFILDGLQAGSEVRLAPGQSRVGSGIDCAVVVADPTMQKDHFEIVVGSFTAIRTLKALLLFDGSVVEPGSELIVSGSTSFIAGATRFCLSAPEGQPRGDGTASPCLGRGRSSRRRFALSVAGGVAVVAGCAALFAGVGTPAHRANAMALAVSRPPPRRDGAGVAALALRQRLDRSGLATLAVAAQQDGTVVVSGLLMPGDQASWDMARQWFDGRFGSDNVLVEQLAPPGSLPPLRIAAVWTGANPYVVDDHGDRLRPGAGLESGWCIERIDADHVFVRRGAEIVALRY